MARSAVPDRGAPTRRRPRAHQLRVVLLLQRSDGNLWIVQEVTTRLLGRIDPTKTVFASAEDLQDALWRAEAAHVEHQKRGGSSQDENWPAWHSSYMVAEQAGSDLPA